MQKFILNLSLPRPLRPTKRRSLNFATWFFMTAVQLRSSPHQLSSFPARIVTMVPSPTSVKATTLNATGRVLLERQWFGSAEHKMYGLPVRTVKQNFKINYYSHAKKITTSKESLVEKWKWWWYVFKRWFQFKYQMKLKPEQETWLLRIKCQSCRRNVRNLSYTFLQLEIIIFWLNKSSTKEWSEINTVVQCTCSAHCTLDVSIFILRLEYQAKKEKCSAHGHQRYWITHGHTHFYSGLNYALAWGCFETIHN